MILFIFLSLRVDFRAELPVGEGHRVDQYSAIVILNSCMAGRPDPRVESIIDEIPDKAKLVVLTTGRLDSWKPDSPAVDAITSASTMSETDAAARTIADKVRVIVNFQNNI